jgi:hypothetical protein
MAKAQFVKAGKDYPQYGIAKGQMHYTWSIFTGASSRTYRQLTPPRRSQLTGSEFLSAVFDIEDDLAALTSLDDLEDIIDRLDTLSSETQDKFDNMPEGLQQGDTGQMLESRANGCSAAKDELDEIKDEYEALGFSRNADGEFVSDEEGEDVPDDAEEQLAELLEKAKAVSIDYE